jgi:hypothetical protein
MGRSFGCPGVPERQLIVAEKGGAGLRLAPAQRCLAGLFRKMKKIRMILRNLHIHLNV